MNKINGNISNDEKTVAGHVKLAGYASIRCRAGYAKLVASPAPAMRSLQLRIYTMSLVATNNTAAKGDIIKLRNYKFRRAVPKSGAYAKLEGYAKLTSYAKLVASHLYYVACSDEQYSL